MFKIKSIIEKMKELLNSVTQSRISCNASMLHCLTEFLERDQDDPTKYKYVA